MRASRRGRDPWPRRRRFPLARLRDHWRVGRESMLFVSHRLATSLVVWMLIGIALALPAGLYLLQHNLADVAAQWQGRPGFSVYFEAGANPRSAESLRDALAASAGVERVWLVTADDALDEFRAYAGLSDALEMLEENPLPTSVRATVAQGVTAEQLTLLAEQARGASGVEDVVIEKTWLERLAAVSAVVKRLGWMLAVLFGIGAVLVTAASVRLAIEARLDELKVLKLVGGPDGFIKRPFLYFGLLYGVGGGVVAAMLVATVLVALESPLTALFGSYGEDLELAGFDLTFTAALLGCGAILGVIGSTIATNQRLSGLEVV